ncbi:MAG: DUF2891 domain-containing protein [Ferrovibrio sp.]|nr:DUF2891 domain-containing protein [Ferrovibrio sp.]
MSMTQRQGGLTETQALRFAALPLRNLTAEYPNHLAHLLNGPADLLPPRALHPIFYGSYDWHSAVHGFWLLARCLRRFPNLPIAPQIVALFDTHLTAEHGVAEAAYFQAPGRAGYERPYGWGWLLALAAELQHLPQAHAADWRAALKPLELVILERLPPYLHKLTYPIRVGTHFNTAFGMLLALHYARSTGQAELAGPLENMARRYYGQDADYPALYEPNGDDFLSGGLTAAFLLAQILPGAEFAAWFAQYLPGYFHGAGGPYHPVMVADRSDAKGVHLDGLNLSRAWCLRGIAAALTPHHSAHGTLQRLADQHEAASLPFLESGEYGGEHWLATFAALAVEGLGD